MKIIFSMSSILVYMKFYFYFHGFLENFFI